MQLFDFGGFKVVAQVFLQDFLEDPLLVVVVVNRKIAIVPLTAHGGHHRFLRKAKLQQAQAHGVESPHPAEVHITIK